MYIISVSCKNRTWSLLFVNCTVWIYWFIEFIEFLEIHWLIDWSYCKKEILARNWVITLEKPTLISALSLVHKPDSDDLRLIHDCPCEKDWMSIPILALLNKSLKPLTLQSSWFLGPVSYMFRYSTCILVLLTWWIFVSFMGERLPQVFSIKLLSLSGAW